MARRDDESDGGLDPDRYPLRSAGRVLVVEDEPKLAALMRRYLEAGGFVVQTIDDGRRVIPAVRTARPDLVLLDLMLPGRDGIDICRELRTFSGVPLVIVTARVEEIDRLLGLALGADDYICKPFSPRELVARVRAILRRTRVPAPSPALAGDPATDCPPSANAPVSLDIDESRHEIRLQGRLLSLTPVEFRLLAILAGTPGRVFRRHALLERLYEDHRVVNDRTVDTHVKNLRRKLIQVVEDRELVLSVYGVGYKYEA